MASDSIDMGLVFPFNHLDDTLFSAALHKLSHSALNYDYNRLETLVFNPIEQITSKFNDPLVSSLDPDLNFFEYSLPKSNYMVEDEVNNLDSTKQYDSSFSLLHLHSRSLLGNFDKFQSLIANLNNTFSLIGVTETWLNDQTSDTVNIPGYYFISNHRKHKTGGGVGIYLRNVFQYKLLHDCTISSHEVIESLFVEICNPFGKNTIVGTVYRPPNQNLNPFMDELNRILSTICKDNKNYGVPLRTKIQRIIFYSKSNVFAVEVEYIKIEVENRKFEVENI